MNRNTVLRALRLLRDEGLLEFRCGHGITVAGTPQRGAVLTRARERVRLTRQHAIAATSPSRSLKACRSPPWPTPEAEQASPTGQWQATTAKPRQMARTESDRIPVRFAASPLPNAD